MSDETRDTENFDEKEMQNEEKQKRKEKERSFGLIFLHKSPQK